MSERSERIISTPKAHRCTIPPAPGDLVHGTPAPGIVVHQ